MSGGLWAHFDTSVRTVELCSDPSTRFGCRPQAQDAQALRYLRSFDKLRMLGALRYLRSFDKLRTLGALRYLRSFDKLRMLGALRYLRSFDKLRMLRPFDTSGRTVDLIGAVASSD